MTNKWRTAAICLAFACLLLIVALALQGRISKVKIVTVEKIKIERKNVIIERAFDKNTGTMTAEKITDKTTTEEKNKEKNKETEKPASKAWIFTAQYNITQSQYWAGAGVIIADTVAVQAMHPIALTFQPTVSVSILF